MLCSLLVALAPFAGPARGELASFTDHASWLQAISGRAEAVFHFDGPTETHGLAADDAAIQLSYASQGVEFLPFLNTSILPVIARGQGFQITDPQRDGLLGNASSPHPASDLEGRAIRFRFTGYQRAVGAFFNIGDGGFLRVRDEAQNVLGETPVSSSGGFIGLVSDQAIHQVDIVCTFDPDIRFGIWALQFAPVTPRLHIVLHRPPVDDAYVELFWPSRTSETYQVEWSAQPYCRRSAPIASALRPSDLDRCVNRHCTT